MNIDEFRAIQAQERADSQKAESGEQPNAQTHEGATPNHESTSAATEQTQSAPVDAGTNETAPPVQEQTQTDVPQTIEINGEQVSIDELKNGYLRTADYTRKTQELAQQRKQLAHLAQIKEQLEANPEVAKQIAQEHGLQALDPEYAVQAQREQEYWDMKLELDLQSMEKQYTDFKRDDVLKVAYDRNVSLEDAYLITKATTPSIPAQQEVQTNSLNVEDIKKSLREELLAELRAEQAQNVDTTSIISSRNGVAPVADTAPKLSPQELKMAEIYGMTPEEYVKWR